MRNRTGNTTKDWMRLVARLGLLFTEPNVREVVGARIKHHAADVADAVSHNYENLNETVASKYEDVVDRLRGAADAWQGKGYWAPRVTGFLLGVGVGAGLGILLAPASGEEVRKSVRDKATDVRDKIRDSVTKMPATGSAG